MTVSTNTFIVAVLGNNNEPKRYYCVDPESGAYFSEYYSSAEKFSNRLQATTVLNGLWEKSKTPQKPDREGVIYPDHDVRDALALSDSKNNLKGEATLAVLEILLDVVQTCTISGEIKKPTGFTYD